MYVTILLRFVPLFLRIKERFGRIGTVYLVNVSIRESTILWTVFDNHNAKKLNLRIPTDTLSLIF
jgi:hypothetical protein